MCASETAGATNSLWNSLLPDDIHKAKKTPYLTLTTAHHTHCNLPPTTSYLPPIALYLYSFVQFLLLTTLYFSLLISHYILPPDIQHLPLTPIAPWQAHSHIPDTRQHHYHASLLYFCALQQIKMFAYRLDCTNHRKPHRHSSALSAQSQETMHEGARAPVPPLLFQRTIQWIDLLEAVRNSFFWNHSLRPRVTASSPSHFRLTVRPSVLPSVCPTVCPSVWLTICASVRLFF